GPRSASRRNGRSGTDVGFGSGTRRANPDTAGGGASGKGCDPAELSVRSQGASASTVDSLRFSAACGCLWWVPGRVHARSAQPVGRQGGRGGVSRLGCV